MRKSLIVPMVMLVGLFTAISYAADDAKLEFTWTPPTDRVLTDCDNPGTPMTQADLDRLEYTLSHREKLATPGPWINTESSDTTVTIENLKWGTTYEAYVGAHWPGEAVFCPTNIIEKATVSEPPPGGCTGLTATQVQ